MHHQRSNYPHRLPAWQGTAAGCLVLVYLLLATPLSAAFTTLLGTTDRSHHVAVQQTASGIRVVLRHDCSATAHRHGWVARTLILAAQKPSGGHPDHVIQFTSGTLTLAAPAILIAFEPAGWLTTVSPSSDCMGELPASTALQTTPPRPPPDATPFHLSLRTTVLVI